MLLVPASAAAYVNHGRWIADCPKPFCGNAMALDPKQARFICGLLDGRGRLANGCGTTADVHWPPDAVWIWDALLRRPDPGTRNWAPAGHRQAVADGFAAGQSVTDLLAEMHARLEAA